MKSSITGRHGIRATVLADSVSAITGDRLTTFEIEYPRIILAELNTHCMLARNSASSRAIPFKKMLEQLYARPMRFGEANPGMQDKGEDYDAPVKISSDLWEAYDEYLWEYHPGATLNDCLTSAEGCGSELLVSPVDAWQFANSLNKNIAGAFHDAGYHKQVYNRLVEASQMMKTVISATEWANFYWLRDHGAADPTIAELARVMHSAVEENMPVTLQPGEWHLPYVDTLVSSNGSGAYYYLDESHVGTTGHIPLEDAIKVSAARTAAVSFRNTDYGLEKSREVYDRLVGDQRKHASAFEHCGTPIKGTQYETWVDSNIPVHPMTWQEGVTHMDRDGALWSAKFRGFIQYRKLIPGENFTGR